ncbi:MAG: 3,4-dehydroadipyl-CoA semialdehyde dehydrogenase [Myxococcota bacterium]
MIQTLKSYTAGKWFEAREGLIDLVNPTTEEIIARASSRGIDFAATLTYARKRGGPALRELGFVRRGQLLGAMAKAIHAYREELIELAIQNGGNTRSDAKFDIDGATATLSYYAKLAEGLGERQFLSDGASHQLGRTPRLMGRHVYAPLHGAAIHINAFNFPAWGFAEKAAVALLAGMPIVSKPATSTAMVAARVAEILVDANVMPDGALSFICGGVGDLLQHVTWQDVVAFTGSAATGLKIRGHEDVLKSGTRVNIEADSLNAAVLGPDITSDAPAYDLFVQEVAKDITQKAGQKCTAIRRILVPHEQLDEARGDLCEAVAAVKYGNPASKEVRMGPLATADQLRNVRADYENLSRVAKPVYGDAGRGKPLDIHDERGFFMTPTLLQADNAEADVVHQREVFGPVATLIPYDGSSESAAHIIRLGGGSLVSSIYSDDADFCQRLMEYASCALGRIHLGASKVAEHSPGPGTVLPMMSHGGPGRAGGGEELGAERGMALYMQRTAVQGYGPWLEKLA